MSRREFETEKLIEVLEPKIAPGIYPRTEYPSMLCNPEDGDGPLVRFRIDFTVEISIEGTQILGKEVRVRYLENELGTEATPDQISEWQQMASRAFHEIWNKGGFRR